MKTHHVHKRLVGVKESLKIEVYKREDGIYELDDNDIIMILFLRTLRRRYLIANEMFASCFRYNDFVDKFLCFGDAGSYFDQVCVYGGADLWSLSPDGNVSQFVEGGDEVGEEFG